MCYQGVKAYQKRVSFEREERDAHTFLLSQAEQRIEAQLQVHFQSIQRISDTTTLPSILPRLKSQLLSLLDISILTEALTQDKDSSYVLTTQERIELWEKLKISSFTRATCCMLALTVAVLFVRVQLNILARHVYLDTARDISTLDQAHQKSTLSKTCQQKYILLSDFLANEGVKLLKSDVEVAVIDALASKPLKELCSLTDLRGIFVSICESLEHNQVDWLAYMVSKKRLLEHDQKIKQMVAEWDVSSHDDMESLEQLLGETKDILKSHEFKGVLAASFGVVLDGVIEELESLFQGRESAKLPLAKLLPPISGIGVLLLELPEDNKFIQLITNLEEVRSFCAAVYSSGH